MKFKVEKRRDNINHRDLYIPQPVAGQPIGVDEIARQINNMCTVTPADVAAVLEALQIVIARNLSQGNSVRLGKVGSFWVKMNTTAESAPDDVTVENIKEIGVKFRANAELKKYLNEARLEKDAFAQN